MELNQTDFKIDDGLLQEKYGSHYNIYWVAYSVLDTIHVLGQLILTSP